MNSPFKILVLLSVLLLFFYSEVYSQSRVKGDESKSEKLCDYFIYLDELKMAKKLGVTNDTVYLSDNTTYYLRVDIKTCKGDMYIERRRCSNNKLVFSGSYLGVDVPDTLTGYGINPVTGETRVKKTIQYCPIKHGIWKFYDKQGVLLREEEYKNGKLIKK